MKHAVLLVAAFLVCIEGVGAQDTTKLNSVRAVYLGDFGQGEGADLVREKVRVLLAKSGRFSVVESQDAADAVLTGAAGVEKAYHSSVSGTSGAGVSGSGGTSYHGYGVLRLVHLKSQEAIWFFEYERGWGFGSRSTRVASQVVDKLLDAAQEAERMTQSPSKQEPLQKPPADPEKEQ